jgi:hypothetical protein
MDIYVVHVLSPEELDPDVKGDLKLLDCEDGDIAEITVSRPLLDRYKRTLASFIDGAREFCTRRGINYVMTSTNVPVEQLVTSYSAPARVGQIAQFAETLDGDQGLLGDGKQCAAKLPLVYLENRYSRYPIDASVVSALRGVPSSRIAGFSPLNLAPFALASTILIWENFACFHGQHFETRISNRG